ncbi:MAG: hypothetical protein ABIQ01_01375 [Pseudolysinimonas sp.]
MPRHRITTASLLRDISERREAAATTRWRQVRRQYMTEAARSVDGDAPVTPDGATTKATPAQLVVRTRPEN